MRASDGAGGADPDILNHSPRHIVITGGAGYIGQRLVAKALARGLRVTVLGRSPMAGEAAAGGRVRWRQWSLNDPVPADAFMGGGEFPPADAVVHLAHQWVSRAPEDADENLIALDRLLEATRRQGVRRFVYCSSVSAKPDALNRYGRVKWRNEQKLKVPAEIAARVGLVYGGPERGQWGLLCRLVRLGPVLPMVGAGRPVQPIHVDDACEGLLRLAGIADPSRAVFVLAAPDPVPFGRFLGMIAGQRFGRRLFVLPLPAAMGWAALAVAPANIGERICGLLGMTVSECRDDLAGFGLVLRNLRSGLVERAAARRRLLAEGRVLVQYLLGIRPSPALMRRYALGVLRHGNGCPLVLPLVTHRWPALLRLIEPAAGGSQPAEPEGLRERLDMATRLIEATPEGAAALYDHAGTGPVAAASAILLTVVGEIVLYPVRLILGGRFR